MNSERLREINRIFRDRITYYCTTGRAVLGLEPFSNEMTENISTNDDTLRVFSQYMLQTVGDREFCMKKLEQYVTDFVQEFLQ